MSAIFHPSGTTFHWVRRRGASEPFYFLGTAVTSPEVEIEKILSPINIDLMGPAPFNHLYHSENHTVTTTLNFFEYACYNMLKSRGTITLNGIQRADLDTHLGNLVMPAEDFEFLLVHVPLTFDAVLQGSSLGRLYYSASPVYFRETTENNRLLEVGIVLKCIPVFVNIPGTEHLPPDNEPTGGFESDLKAAPTNKRDFELANRPRPGGVAGPAVTPEIAAVASALGEALGQIVPIGGDFLGQAAERLPGGFFYVPPKAGAVAAPVKKPTAPGPGKISSTFISAKTPSKSASPIPPYRKAAWLYSEIPADWFNRG